MPTIRKLPRIYCAHCQQNATVHWIDNENLGMEMLVWVECHRHAMVIISHRTIATAEHEQPPRDYIDLIACRDISGEVQQMYTNGEIRLGEYAAYVGKLEAFLKVAT